MSMRNTIRTLVAEEMFNGLLFPAAKRYMTIHKELKTIFLPEQT